MQAKCFLQEGSILPASPREHGQVGEGTHEKHAGEPGGSLTAWARSAALRAMTLAFPVSTPFK